MRVVRVVTAVTVVKVVKIVTVDTRESKISDEKTFMIEKIFFLIFGIWMSKFKDEPFCLMTNSLS